MGEIQVLDCTLRDGGRCFGNTWGDTTIKSISKGLSDAGIDIIEIGFLWYIADGICRENSTHFRSFQEIEEFLCPDQNYAAYIEYEVFKKGVYSIVPKEKSSITGIRLGVLKEDIKESLTLMEDIIDKGYQLYVQGINTLSYTEDELLDFIQIINTVKPYAFAIVDTFGNMQQQDLIEKFQLIDKNLDKNIAIAFHSHNNKNQSMELAKTFATISEERDIVIDSTLMGIGMGAGNLNTELITKYLNQEKEKNYDISILQDLINKYIVKFRDKFVWGCTAVSIDSAKTWRSQIDVSYITTEYKYLTMELQRYLLAMCAIGRGTALGKIDGYAKLLLAPFPSESDYKELQKHFTGKKIVIVGRGPSVTKNKEKLAAFGQENDAIFVYINAHERNVLGIDSHEIYYFFSRENGYEFFRKGNVEETVITLAGFKQTQASKGREYTIHVRQCTEDVEQVADDGVMWMLNLLHGMKNQCEVFVAGFDGGDAGWLQIEKYRDCIENIRKDVSLSFLTESVYEEKGNSIL